MRQFKDIKNTPESIKDLGQILVKHNISEEHRKMSIAVICEHFYMLGQLHALEDQLEKTQ